MVVLARRTQRERRDETRAKLLDATLACLGELGVARTTTTEVVQRAGVSQGALFKHFPSKAALLSAAVEQLFSELVEGYEGTFAQLPRDASHAFDLLWAFFTGPKLAIAFELYLTARTDEALQAALEPVVRTHRAQLIAHARVLFPEAAAKPEFDAWIDLMMMAMEGLVVERFGAGDVGAPALAVLKRLSVAMLERRS
ncbi:MAG TPA: TetR/AcrR family transcriptional regulator [Polyangiales bacterium]|nr:TetR/AcrR family transcriptional regulator [Polyangiales bacterium]